MKLIVVSGRSGSGKSAVLHILEDLGYYCIDGLPLNLLSSVLKDIQAKEPLVAISIDSRNLSLRVTGNHHIIEQIKRDTDCDIIYLDATDSKLLQRFKETRRKHPLSKQDTTLKEALKADKALLLPLAEYADLTINTSDLTPYELKQHVINSLDHKLPSLAITVMSFGFKHGSPMDADFLFDARCLPNPYWEENLRTQSGKDQDVIHFLKSHPTCLDMSQDMKHFFEKWLKAFQAENRKYLTIAIGCTGGQHRSVFLTEELGDFLRQLNNKVTLRHRDMKA
jgi:RNase adapter protein RapZ